MQIGPLTGVTG